MPVSTLNGWTSGGLLPSYATVSNILGQSGSRFNPTNVPAAATTPGSSIPPSVSAILNPPTTPPPAGAPTNTAATAGLSADVWGRLGTTVRQRLLKSFSQGTGQPLKNDPTAAANAQKAGIDPGVWARLGTTEQSRILKAATKPTPATPAPANPLSTVSNPFLFNYSGLPTPTASTPGWSGGGFG